MREMDVLLMERRNTDATGLRKANKQPAQRARIVRGLGRFEVSDQPIISLVRYLEDTLQVPIVDRTGLQEHYDFVLNWSQPNRTDLNIDGLKQAMIEQLGLELVPAHEKIEVLVLEQR